MRVSLSFLSQSFPPAPGAVLPGAMMLLALGLIAGGCGDDGGSGDGLPRGDGFGGTPVGFREVTVSYPRAGTDDDTLRELPARIWYPAAPTGDEEPADYTVSLLVTVPTERAVADPPVAPGGPYPVAVYSHGSGGEGLLAYPYAEVLASNGWIVISPNHVGNTALDDLGLGDGRSSRSRIVLDRPNDVSAMLDYLESGLAEDDPLFGLADTDRALLFGHSFGGYSTFAAAGADVDLSLLDAGCRAEQELVDDCGFIADPGNETRCEDAEEPFPECALLDDDELAERCEERSSFLADCAVVLDPAFRAGFEGEFLDRRFDAIVPQAPALVGFGEGELASVDIPMLLQTGRRDQTTTQETSAIPSWERTDGPEDVWIDMPGAGHFSFLTICTDLDVVLPEVNMLFGLPEGTPLLEGVRPDAVEDGCGPSFTPSTDVVDALARYTLAWGVLHVLGDEDARAAFEAPPPVADFEIVFRQ
ncbi:MAG TPA: hypothetical protein RMF84_14450 [Polyangiaceae bacterium LLY-WYZ-14_1]|nr:hypothetical protein [Polyangiaceae bacterium LLY-WYZ-14_1]